MSTHDFLMSVSFLLAMMGGVALLELAVPMFAARPAGRVRTATNLGLTMLTFAFNWLLTGAAAVIALAAGFEGPGAMTELGIPLAVQIVVAVAVLDFGFGYLAHRAMHVSPVLWRVHRVHHCDPFVDVTTTYRNHPIEGCWRFLFVVIPVWALGLPAEAVVIHRMLSAANGILEHANLRMWRPLDRVLSLILVTPHLHKIHHSRVSAETDSNYGNVFSIYDRLLRTLTPSERAFSVEYGLDDVDRRRATSLKELLAMPFRRREPARGFAVGNS